MNTNMHSQNKKRFLLFRKKFLFRFLISLLLIFIISYFGADAYIKHNVKNQIYSSTESIPHNKVGMVLGTSKFLKKGTINQYYQYRIDATTQLYKAGKIDFILISGDNGTVYYDEPTTFKNDLIEKGIPENKIFLDYAGFRTLDSVVRAKKIFGQNKITIISQQFHIERAIFIAKNNDIDAIGFKAKDVGKNYGVKTKVREKLARIKVFIDILINKQPKFLGEEIKIQ